MYQLLELIELYRQAKKETELINSHNMLDKTYFITHYKFREFRFRVEFYRVRYFLGKKIGFTTDFIGHFTTIDEAKNYVDALRQPVIFKNL